MQEIAFTTEAPVAVLDSGAGGIGVLAALTKRLPCEHFVYFGDSSFAPYGERDEQELQNHLISEARRLLGFCKALVIACNTATSVAAKEIRAAFPTRQIIGMEPALKPALSVSAHPRIAVLATAPTLSGAKFGALCRALSEKADIYPLPAPELVRFVEAGKGNGTDAEILLHTLFRTLPLPPDAVVLGCTHFPFATGALRRVVGELPFFDGAAGTAAETARRLSLSGLLRTGQSRGVITLTAGDAAHVSTYRHLLLSIR